MQGVGQKLQPFVLWTWNQEASSLNQMEAEIVQNPCPIYGEVCLRKQRRKRQKLLLTQLFLDFARNTTLHGLRYMAESGLYLAEKFFWCLTFLLSVCIAFSFIYSVWHKWHTSPVIVSFNAKHVSVDEVPFPSVTICPQVKFLISTFNYTNVTDTYEDNPDYFNNTYNSDDIRTAKAVALICDFKEIFSKSITNTDSSAIETLFNISVDYDAVFTTCKWRGVFCKDNLFKRVLTKNGVCFNFNGLMAENILRTDILQNKYNYTLTTEKIRNWTIDGGYLNKKHEYVYPYRGSDNNGDPNLILELSNLNKERDKKCNGLYSGYKIYLHHPADLPQAALYHFAALPKQLTSMGVKFTMETARREDMRKYPVDIRQCYLPEDRHLKYFKIYTYNNCKLECLTLFTYKYCGCVSFHMPHTNSTEICSASNMYCVKRAEAEFTESEEEDVKKCECLPACNSIQYDAEIHKTDYNLGTLVDAHYGKWLKETFNETYDPESNSESRVEIFFKEPNFMSVHRSELFGLTDFLGTCGGILGLFLGFSFLSLVEIFYFLTFRVFKTIRSDLKSEKTKAPMNDLQSVFVCKSE